MSTLQVGLSVLCALAAISVIVEIIGDRQPGNVTFFTLIAVEIGVVVQLVWGIAMVIDNHQGVELGTYFGYLVGALVVLPVAYLWSVSEKSRGGTAVLLVAVIVMPVLFLRLHDIWSTHV